MSELMQQYEQELNGLIAQYRKLLDIQEAFIQEMGLQEQYRAYAQARIQEPGEPEPKRDPEEQRPEDPPEKEKQKEPDREKPKESEMGDPEETILQGIRGNITREKSKGLT